MFKLASPQFRLKKPANQTAHNAQCTSHSRSLCSQGSGLHLSSRRPALHCCTSKKATSFSIGLIFLIRSTDVSWKSPLFPKRPQGRFGHTKDQPWGRSGCVLHGTLFASAPGGSSKPHSCHSNWAIELVIQTVEGQTVEAK